MLRSINSDAGPQSSFSHDVTGGRFFLASEAPRPEQVDSAFWGTGEVGSSSRVSSLRQTAETIVAEMQPDRIYDGVSTELLTRVPFDERGHRTSIGSIGHYEETCHGPCCFVHLPSGCRNGVYCEWCHFPHERDTKKKKSQPCKAQRNRYRRHQERLLAELDQAPHLFDLDRVELPQCISSNDSVKAKTLRMLQERLEYLATAFPVS